MTKRAGVYCRISVEDADNPSLSPESQRTECEKLCKANGYQVSKTYVDRGISAYSGARRPRYEAMLADVVAGKIDVVVAYSIDRLTREGVAGFARLAEVVTAAGAELITVHDPALNITSALGQGVAALMASIARMESERISTRVKTANLRELDAGLPHQGGNRAYGYTRRGEVLPVEAAIIMEAAERLTAGESLRSIAEDLNGRGVPTSTGGTWRPESLARTLRSPRTAGMRTHHGVLSAGSWPAILPLDQWTELLGTMGEPAAIRQDTRAGHLLTGVVRCGVCNARLKVRQDSGRAFVRYYCPRIPGTENCGGIVVSKGPTDRYVVAELLRYLEALNVPAVQVRRKREELKTAILADEAELAELGRRRFVARTMGDDEYEPLRAALRTQLMASKDELAALTRQEQAGRPAGDDYGAWWAGLSAPEQRAVILANVATVRILPARRRGRTFDTGRIVIGWLRWPFLIRAAEEAGYVGAGKPGPVEAYPSPELAELAEVEAEAATRQ